MGKAAQTRARLLAIKRADFRETVLGVAQTYESWAREIENSAGEADASESRRPLSWRSYRELGEMLAIAAITLRLSPPARSGGAYSPAPEFRG